MDIRELIAAERRDLADVLDGLGDGQWDAPSLCAGWRTREVAAHITMPFRPVPEDFAAEMQRAAGDVERINRVLDEAARRDAAKVPAAELVAALRDNAETDWAPPGGDLVAAFNHDVIHGLDITVALGVDRRVPRDRMRVILDGLQPHAVAFFGVDLTGIELRADDLDWSYGEGEPLTGAAQDLLLVICGRRLPAGHLRGRDAARFTA
ncbi:maleylpyruvate isomerase family mycothiol-dependent enzyme [Actinomadura miaoliensis]|uniref:Maleylpyruvate isomerase family mycothiol-dependent enzyme n=1 Tax=Actinomadura miaoliensis TaxID=430685 RepID=A0ABP7WJX0_9ACTN